MEEQKKREFQEALSGLGYERKVSKGNFVFQEGERSEAVYVILEGSVKIYKNTSDGKELTVFLARKGEMIGDFSLFSANEEYTFNALAIEKVTVCAVLKKDIEKEVLKDGNFAAQCIQWLNFHNKKTEMKFRDLLLYGKKGALYSTLIRLVNTYGVIQKEAILIDIKINNRELAKFCGMTRETVSRMLSELKQMHVIDDQKGRWMVYDLDYIKQEISCENCPVELCRMY